VNVTIKIELTIAEARAFKRMLAQHITPEDRAFEALAEETARREEEAADARAMKIYEAVHILATKTAQQDGVTTIPPYLQARAAWEAFEASEGYYSRYDVDERWEPDADDAETWELAYVTEIERIKKEAHDATP
jgi:hypothetical protein